MWHIMIVVVMAGHIHSHSYTSELVGYRSLRDCQVELEVLRKESRPKKGGKLYMWCQED